MTVLKKVSITRYYSLVSLLEGQYNSSNGSCGTVKNKGRVPGKCPGYGGNNQRGESAKHSGGEIEKLDVRS